MFAKIGKIGERGKKIAGKIYARSKRSAGAFIPIDCDQLSKELAAFALFGHEKGGVQESWICLIG